MKIASWNVNSIKARLTHVKRWLAGSQPDVLLLQELKGESFPAEEFEAMGYQSMAVTQKAYNGVAVLYKGEATMITDALPGDETDTQARFIDSEYHGIRIINIYLPNGNPAGTEKYDYKLAWMDRLLAYLKPLRDQNIPFVIGGDFNVIPEDRDCHDPKAWADDALFLPQTRAKWRALLNLGLYDAFRISDDRSGQYTFWDYQRGAWQKDHGIRIDHFLLSPGIVDQLNSCVIDCQPRGEEKASDHTPIILDIV